MISLGIRQAGYGYKRLTCGPFPVDLQCQSFVPVASYLINTILQELFGSFLVTHSWKGGGGGGQSVPMAHISEAKTEHNYETWRVHTTFQTVN